MGAWKPARSYFEKLSCTTGNGQLDCLRKQDAFALQAVLLATGNQFQPVIDNITIFKDYVKQTKDGRTAKIPLLIGTNMVWLIRFEATQALLTHSISKNEGTLIVNSEPTAFTNETAYM